jgi:hypothetical protein
MAYNKFTNNKKNTITLLSSYNFNTGESVDYIEYTRKPLNFLEEYSNSEFKKNYVVKVNLKSGQGVNVCLLAPDFLLVKELYGNSRNLHTRFVELRNDSEYFKLLLNLSEYNTHIGNLVNEQYTNLVDTIFTYYRLCFIDRIPGVTIPNALKETITKIHNIYIMNAKSSVNIKPQSMSKAWVKRIMDSDDNTKIVNEILGYSVLWN